MIDTRRLATMALMGLALVVGGCDPQTPDGADAASADAEPMPDQGRPIECITDDECSDGQVCDAGRCIERPACDCPAIEMPVCGADGVTYSNACQAMCAAVAVASDGPCPEPCVCPEIIDPVCGADGMTYDNDCLAACAGVDVDRPGPCDAPQACGGGDAGQGCPDDAYCAYEGGGCGTPEEAGVCTPIPDDCPEVVEPVCGCDGVTYDNACRARAAATDVNPDVNGPCPCPCPEVIDPVCGADGVTYDNACLAGCVGVEVSEEGPCEVACGTRGADACSEDAWCDFAEGCGADDRGGVCRPRPDGCDDVFLPVCGCDGETWPNACEAQAAGVDVERDGACDEAACTPDDCGPQPGLPNFECDDGSVGGPTGRCLRGEDDQCGWEIRECPDAPPPVPCGARLGDTCDEDSFCDFEQAGCDFADATGICRPRPADCEEIVARVCGCDGNTYDNACAAQAARTDVAAEGACDAPIEACEPEQCGPPPGLPNVQCDDGTIGGPTGRCLRGRDGRCGWEIRECP